LTSAKRAASDPFAIRSRIRSAIDGNRGAQFPCSTEIYGETAVSGSKKSDFSFRILMRINILRSKFRYAAEQRN
jgi:hypothetical protein